MQPDTKQHLIDKWNEYCRIESDSWESMRIFDEEILETRAKFDVLSDKKWEEINAVDEKVRKDKTLLLRSVRDLGYSTAEIARILDATPSVISRFVRYTGGKNCPESIKWAVLKRDNEKCVSCGTKRKKLHVHHVKTDKHTMKNLVTLCSSCHPKIEKEKRLAKKS